MNLYSNLLLFQLSKDDKHQSKGVNDFLLQHMFPPTKQRKIFHIDCAFTKKKICYCKYHESELMPKQERAFYESTIEFLEDEFKGKDKQFYKDIFERRNFCKEKYKNLQEPEDIQYYMNFFDESNTLNKPPVIENNPTKRVHTETNNYVNVKPNGNNTFNPPNQEALRKRRPDTSPPESTRATRKNLNEEDLEGLCHFESCTKPNSDQENFLACGRCKKTFHAKCCSPPLNKAIVARYPWYCNDCKLCFVCKSNVDENKMIICDICDRAFHSDCLSPKLNEIPHGDWYCNECKKCKSCSESLKKEPNFPNLGKNLWHNEFLLCGRCLGNFKKNAYCPICLRTINEEEGGDYVCCDRCNLWVHTECDSTSDQKFRLANQPKYVCPICRSRT